MFVKGGVAFLAVLALCAATLASAGSLRAFNHTNYIPYTGVYDSHPLMRDAILANDALIRQAVRRGMRPSDIDAAVLRQQTLRGSDDVILMPPNPKASRVAAVVWVQGASIPAVQYTEIAQTVQAAFASKGVALWVGIPQFPLSTAEPLVIGAGIDRVLGKLYNGGMPRTAFKIAAAHSLGGVFLQDWLMSNGTQFFQAAVYMGTFITRANNGTFSTPILTIGGEMDGLCRIFRIAQSYIMFTQDANNGMPDPRVNQPVIAFPGMTHMQFASGTPPSLVHDEDLVPNITYAAAHQQVADAFSAFIVDSQMNPTGAKPSTVIESMLNSSMKIFNPIFDSFELEGNYRLKPPCNCNNPTNIKPDKSYFPIGGVNYYPCLEGVTPQCRAGSKWGEFAQEIMGGLTNITYNVTSAFHPVSQEHPTNLAYIFDNCTTQTKVSCTLRITVVNMNIYPFDPLDTGFFEQSANAIAGKMMSREAVYIHAGLTNAQYDNTDKGKNLCAELNAQALGWALANAPPAIADRYRNEGQHMVFGADEPQGWGPGFIGAHVSYKTNAQGDYEVRSPSLPTPYRNFFIPFSCCFHYCKMVSPSRALEWVYLDSLRYAHSLANNTAV